MKIEWLDTDLTEALVIRKNKVAHVFFSGACKCTAYHTAWLFKVTRNHVNWWVAMRLSTARERILKTRRLVRQKAAAVRKTEDRKLEWVELPVARLLPGRST